MEMWKLYTADNLVANFLRVKGDEPERRQMVGIGVLTEAIPGDLFLNMM